jgi:hypothetical protein
MRLSNLRRIFYEDVFLLIFCRVDCQRVQWVIKFDNVSR